MQDPDTRDAAPDAPPATEETMMANLRKDVTSWNKDRRANEGISHVAIGAPAPRKAATRSAKPAAPAPAPVAADGKKQPFRMSYDGVSASEYAAYRHARGAR